MDYLRHCTVEPFRNMLFRNSFHIQRCTMRLQFVTGRVDNKITKSIVDVSISIPQL